jgi:hypothetical protein
VCSFNRAAETPRHFGASCEDRIWSGFPVTAIITRQLPGEDHQHQRLLRIINMNSRSGVDSEMPAHCAQRMTTHQEHWRYQSNLQHFAKQPGRRLRWPFSILHLQINVPMEPYMFPLSRSIRTVVLRRLLEMSERVYRYRPSLP